MTSGITVPMPCFIYEEKACLFPTQYFPLPCGKVPSFLDWATEIIVPVLEFPSQLDWALTRIGV